MGNNCNCKNYPPEKEMINHNVSAFQEIKANEETVKNAKASRSIPKEETQVNLPLQKEILDKVKELKKSQDPNLKIEEISMTEFNQILQENPVVNNIISQYSEKFDNINPGSEEIYQLMPIVCTNEPTNDKEYFLGHTTINGDIQGVGTLITKDKEVYKGTFKNGTFDGNGVFVNKNGEYYIGDWVEGKSDGQGVLSLSDGTKYEGEFKDNAKHGKGKLIYPDGTEYSGDFNNNEKTGSGTIKYKDGSSYTGEFSNDMFNGQGEYQWEDGRVYKGNFEYGVMQGKGETIWQDGAFYKGYYKDGKKQGYGTYSWPDGKTYVGNWMNNEPNGTGHFKIDGKKYDVTFRNGKLVNATNTDTYSKNNE